MCEKREDDHPLLNAWNQHSKKDRAHTSIWWLDVSITLKRTQQYQLVPWALQSLTTKTPWSCCSDAPLRRLQHMCPLVAMFRGTGLLAKSIKMEHILSLGMKYVCAAQKIANSFVHRGTLKAFSAENHSRAEGYLDAVLLFYGRSQFRHHHSHMLLLNDPAAVPHCLYLLTIEKYLHEKYSKRREVNKTVIWTENIKQRFSSLHKVIDF